MSKRPYNAKNPAAETLCDGESLNITTSGFGDKKPHGRKLSVSRKVFI